MGGLEKLGACAFHDRTPREKIIERARDAEAVLTNKAVLDKEILAALPKLKYIGITATGTNAVDLAVAKAQGITVTNVPAYSTDSVAQLAIALLLQLTNNVAHYNTLVHEGRWQRSPDFSFIDCPLIELAGLTMGIVGFGAIGQATAKLAQALA